MREDSADETKLGNDYTYDDLVNQNVLQQGGGNMGYTNPEPPRTNQPPMFEGNDITSGSPTGPLQNVAQIASDTYRQAQQQQQQSAPSPSPGTYTPPNPPPFSGNAPTPQPASSGIPPDLMGILNSLKEGISNFRIPPINIQPQTTPAYDDLVRNAIMDAIRGGQQPVDATDPMIAPLLAAMQGQGQRAKEQNQGRLAEQLSAKHLLSSGAYDTGVERYNQGVDEATGGSLAQLMTNVLGQRQQKLMQAIQMGANYLNADQARQLQAELANVNSALAQYQAKSSVGLGTLASLLQNQQFYDQLGSNIGMFTANQNSNASNFFG